MLKQVIDLYVVSAYLCVIDSWLLFPSKFIFLFFSLELTFSWAQGPLSGDYISHSALQLCMAMWLCFHLWSARRCDVYICHITCLKGNFLLFTASFLFLPPGTQTWQSIVAGRATKWKETRSLNCFVESCLPKLTAPLHL